MTPLAGDEASDCSASADASLPIERRIRPPRRTLHEIAIDLHQRPVGRIGHIGIGERHARSTQPHHFSGHASAPLEQILQPLQIVEHRDDTATGEAEIDATLEIIRAVIGKDRGELCLAGGIAFVNPAHCLAQFTHRVISVLDMHADRGVRDHPAGRTVLGVERGIAQRDVEIETVVERGLLHGEPLLWERTVNMSDGQGKWAMAR